ncbi:hypothetical protein MLD38_018381 [Melastoma candidum]|uniref:Uncharacterized protein n=1 Tax=Melastoma candidum TaxID=119954 RepID=A0ACB9QXP7_9MYRT|nr:hypothetical protein MLD38_018381 [Melastoma candidum]
MPTLNPKLPSNSLYLSPTHHLQTKRATFKSRMSPLKPLTPPNPKVVSLSAVLDDANVGSGDSARLHLSNLDRLLGKRQSPSSEEVREFPVDEEKKGRGLFGGLNFARIWKDGSAEVEETVEGGGNCFQQLLSTTNEYSPRNGLGGRWREYHGRDDWAGMLDPLDENLRREVVRYGEFVQAAYHAFHSSPATWTGEEEGMETSTSSACHVASVDRTYRVTRNLYATSSVGLPGWVDDVAPDLGWLTQRSSRIGYVAVCDDRREIQRMGRRDIVIALRGTSTCLEWAENLRANLVPVSDDEALTSHGKPKVECGFLSLYKTNGVHIPSLSESIVREVKDLIETYKNETLSITVTGHSLGAALALLVADELSTVLVSGSTSITQPPPVAVFSFGGPKVGNRSFGDRIKSKNVKVLRIVNNQDIITKVPAGISLNESTKQQLRKLARIEVTTPWDGYSHVGTELRVDTRMSPYLRPDADAVCCHDLEAYLHLVDGFLSSNCPFRSNAKRSLAKLINEQRSNVKRLYTSNAMATGGLEFEGARSGTTSSATLPRTRNILVQ